LTATALFGETILRFAAHARAVEAYISAVPGCDVPLFGEDGNLEFKQRTWLQKAPVPGLWRAYDLVLGEGESGDVPPTHMFWLWINDWRKRYNMGSK